MIKIRLARFGKKNDPFYRVVAIDERKKTTGQSLEVVGYWHPRTELKEVDTKKIKSWEEKGAIVTPAVKKLIK